MKAFHVSAPAVQAAPALSERAERSSPSQRRFAGLAARYAILALASLCSLPAWSLYKVVGPDGKVTYTDRPPTTGTQSTTPVAAGNSSAGGIPGLPYELQQVASRFPVTLYTSSNCSPCDSGRNFLNQRGIPFVERTVSTAADIDALTRLEGLSQVPVLRIGGQRLTGFSEAEWGSYLDIAGYPKQSRLPSSYRNPPAAPLVTPAAAPQPAETAPAPAPRTEPAAPAGNAPPGFRF